MTSLTIRVFTDGLERNAIHVRNAWTSLTVKSQLTDIAQIRACFFDTLDERLLTFANPDTGVVVLKMRYECMITMEVQSYLLVWLVRSLGVSNLGLEVIFPLDDKVLQGTIQVISIRRGAIGHTRIPLR